jgi:hypothetical protein
LLRQESRSGTNAQSCDVHNTTGYRRAADFLLGFLPQAIDASAAGNEEAA